ncbi:MAG: HAD family hydrolase [Solirubrobacteraceae bacterium]
MSERAAREASSGGEELGEEAGSIARPARGLLMDWGGVMTHNLFESFSAFCEAECLDPHALANAFRTDEGAREMLFGFEEGRVREEEFEGYVGGLLGVASAAGLVDRLFSDVTIDEAMVGAVRTARASGVRTGLVSNSWGTKRYPRDLLGELFDGIVISGEVGIRKPAPRIYELGAEAIELPPSACAFVDDLPFNLPPARELGMSAIHHTSTEETIAELERLLTMPLR